MDFYEFTDELWLKVQPAFTWLSEKMGDIASPLMLLGPAVGIFLLALLTYTLIKVLSRLYKPDAEQKLNEEFTRLQKRRNEAKQMGAKEVVKGFDQQLDEIYFERLRASVLRGAAVHTIPMLTMLCWVYSYYTPDKLKAMFGNPHVIELPFKLGKYDYIGAAFWFFLSLVIIWIVHAFLNGFVRRRKKKTRERADLPTREVPIEN